MLQVVNRGYIDHKGRTIVGNMPIGNEGDEGTYFIDYECFFGTELSYNISLSVTLNSNDWYLNGATWSQLGFTSGDVISFTGITNSQGDSFADTTRTIIFIDGNRAVLDAGGSSNSAALVSGKIQVTKNPQAVKTHFNIIPKDQPSGINSLIDASTPTVLNDAIGAMSVSDVLPMYISGDLSGNAISSATIERLSDNNGNTRFRVKVKFFWWLFLSRFSDEHFGAECPALYIYSEFMPLWNNPAVALSKGFKLENDGNTGFRNENFNQNVNNFKLNSISFFDGSNQVSGIDYSKPINFEIKVENITGLGFSSEMGLILFNDIEDEDGYNNPNFNHLSQTIFTQKSDIPTNGTGVTFVGFADPNGAQLTIDVKIDIIGQVATYSGTITPNFEFNAKFSNPNNTDKRWVLMPRLESTTVPATNYSDTVNLLGWIGDVEAFPPFLGGYFDSAVLNDHDDNLIHTY